MNERRHIRPRGNFGGPFNYAEPKTETTASLQAIDAINSSRLVECSAEDWPTVRTALQDFAGQCIDSGQHNKAIVALEEVKRLDGKFESQP